jgi:hypothetical protein
MFGGVPYFFSFSPKNLIIQPIAATIINNLSIYTRSTIIGAATAANIFDTIVQSINATIIVAAIFSIFFPFMIIPPLHY